MTGLDWRKQAACAGHDDPDMFHPLALEKGYTTTSPAIAAAIAVCDRCPVTETCLQWAVSHHIRYGIWGGQTPAQRAGIEGFNPHLPASAAPSVRVKRHTSAWTPTDEAQLIAYDAAGMSQDAIARLLHRSRAAVVTRLHHLRAHADI